MSDKINELTPGQPLSEKDKEALGKANADATAEAHRLAAEHRARDMANGSTPPVNIVASSIREKLERKEFQGTPTPEQEAEAQQNP